MLLATKYEAGVHLDEEENDYEQRHHEKLETIIHTSVEDQNYSDIIFDDLFMDNNSGHAEHDTNAHDKSLHDFETLLNNV
ncbi:hypothetical protein Tco_1567157, partial [Tanacetum coccineum]